MKKTLILMAMCLFVMAAAARPVTQREAACVANRFWQTVLHGEGQVYPCPWQYSQVYLFVGERQGFVLVSADDCARGVG